MQTKMSSLAKTIPQILIQRAYSSELTTCPAVIKVPVYVQRYEKKRKKAEEDRKLVVLRKIVRRGDLNVPVITSNNKAYNYYLGQVYNEKFPIPLLSRYWMKAKTAGQKFTISPWDVNPSLPMKLDRPPVLLKLPDKENMSHFISQFNEMNLSKEVVEALNLMGFQYPTPIQAMVIPTILQHKNVVCVAESGSGKTMTYLIPIIENLKRCKDKQERYPNTPLALIVVPGRELAEQIALAGHQLGLSCGVRVKLLIPEGTEHDFLKPLRREPFDILVATFGIAYRLANRRILNFSHIKHLVFDEADTLLDDSFLKARNRFLSHVVTRDTIVNPEAKDFGAQLIFVSTTMPKDVYSIFENDMEDKLAVAVSPYSHRVLPHVSQKFIRVNNENRAGVFLELLKNDVRKNIPVMVFSNKWLTCNWLGHFLTANDIPHVKFHSCLTLKERAEALRKFQSGDVDVFCCTDLASRGLDTQRVRHVINFDFPNNVSDYILRVGRTGRVGTNHGHVTSLIVSKSSVYVVQDIELAVRKSIELPNVDADIKKKIRRLYYKVHS